MQILAAKKQNFKYELLATMLLLCISWVYYFQVPNASDIIANSGFFLLFATFLGIFMAMSIGANDVANNMGPAVGSKALTLTLAIIIAAICEASGAILAGSDVVDTIKGGIIDGEQIQNAQIMMYIMLSTLLGAALWVSIATFSKAPVSATHSILGALMGAGMVAAGSADIVQWTKVLQIFLSWIISPVMGGIIAIILFLSINKTILKQKNVGEAAKKWVPVFVGIMAWVFTTYLILKGLKSVIGGLYFINPETALFFGYVVGILVYLGLSFYYSKKEKGFFSDSKKFVNRLFNIPLIFAVALLSFAHGANDVANAIGPLAAINDIIMSGEIGVGSLGIPLWIMVIGGFGIAMGLMIFGGRLIKAVGKGITKLNQIRAYSVALSAAITVLIASHLGLPVSSTHIAIGGIFGIGLLREYIKHAKGKDKDYIDKTSIMKIVLAWLITLPISGLISGGFYYILMKF